MKPTDELLAKTEALIQALEATEATTSNDETDLDSLFNPIQPIRYSKDALDKFARGDFSDMPLSEFDFIGGAQ